ncbi:putative rapamycin-insensitive companion of mTOR [Apostichopus japonicus]|uniref:Putative rapamycin-insensitive companion of mTOR n=1 Tax=Stichopus japonicus TaxID=307972 RepID=A0A2G8LH71_STIJA|nr:putative rapamycin-insensitive companion of mTOR [Apostichopus japonicus]
MTLLVERRFIANWLMPIAYFCNVLYNILTAYATVHYQPHACPIESTGAVFPALGVENLVCQLYDKDKQVSTEALAVLDEACEDEINLHSLVQIRPSLLHLGDHGALLLTSGDGDQRSIHSHKRQSAEGFLLRRSQNDSKRKKDVFVPVHLYGQLVQHKIGAELLEKQNVIPELCSRVHLADISSSERLMELKSALWCLGHMGSSPLGLKLLEKMNIIPEIIRLAEECEVFSIRG